MKPEWSEIRASLRARHGLRSAPPDPRFRETLKQRLGRKRPSLVPWLSGIRLVLAAVVIIGAFVAATLIALWENEVEQTVGRHLAWHVQVVHGSDSGFSSPELAERLSVLRAAQQFACYTLLVDGEVPDAPDETLELVPGVLFALHAVSSDSLEVTVTRPGQPPTVVKIATVTAPPWVALCPGLDDTLLLIEPCP